MVMIENILTSSPPRPQLQAAQCSCENQNTQLTKRRDRWQYRSYFCVLRRQGGTPGGQVSAPALGEETREAGREQSELGSTGSAFPLSVPEDESYSCAFPATALAG